MKKKAIVIVLIIGLSATALAMFLNNRHNDSGALLLSGNVEVTETNLGFKTGGRIASLLVDEGGRVAKGDLIATLDNRELKALVEQNRASVAIAEAEEFKASKDFERFESLRKEDAVSVQQMDAALRARDGARSQIRLARAALAASEQRLDDTELRAPISGVVLARNSEVGELAAAGAVVCTIGDIEHPWIKVYVKEDKLGLVKLGQKAEIRTDTYPKKVYEGTVTYISSEAEFTPKTVQTKEERVKLVFGVKVSVRNENEELKPGMPADVKILLK